MLLIFSHSGEEKLSKVSESFLSQCEYLFWNGNPVHARTNSRILFESIVFVLAWSLVCVSVALNVQLCPPTFFIPDICLFNFTFIECVEPEYEVSGENSLRPASK